MAVEPYIINNAKTLKSQGIDPNSTVPKHTLGFNKDGNYNFLSNYHPLNQMNTNLTESRMSGPPAYSVYPGNEDDSCNQFGGVITKSQPIGSVVKENISSNIIRDMPKSSLPNL